MAPPAMTPRPCPGGTPSSPSPTTSTSLPPPPPPPSLTFSRSGSRATTRGSAGAVSVFGKPSEASRSALDAAEVAVGEHRLAIKPELKEAALRLSKCLDQVVSIVTEVFKANGSSTLHAEAERVCHLLLVILETSLYMELCVSQSCGIRPVLGRFEDFSEGIKALLHA